MQKNKLNKTTFDRNSQLRERRLLSLFTLSPHLIGESILVAEHLTYPPYRAMFAGMQVQTFRPGFDGKLDFGELEAFVSSKHGHLSGESVVEALAYTGGDSGDKGVAPRVQALESKILRGYKKRQFRLVLNEGVDEADGRKEKDPSEDIQKTIDSLSGLLEGGQFSVAPTAREVDESIDRIYTQEFFQRSVSIGYDGITNKVGPIMPGRAWMLSGLPGKGKSLFTANVINHWLQKGAKVLWYSTEMPNAQNLMRLYGLHSGGDLKSLQEKINNKEESLANIRAFFVREFGDLLLLEDRYRNVDDIVRQAKYLIKHAGVEIVVIDHVRRLVGKGRSPFDREVYCVERLDELLIGGDVFLWLVSQVSKAGGKGGVDVHSVKGASDWGEFVSTSLYISRDKKVDGDDDSEDSNIVKIKSTKQRDGEPVTVRYKIIEGGVIK